MLNKKEIKQRIITNTEEKIIEQELMLEFIKKQQAKAPKDTQINFKMQIEDLEKKIQADKIFLKDF